MKYHQLFLWGLCGFFLLSKTVEANLHGDHKLSSDFSQSDIYQAKFKCPHVYGNYPDTQDCSHYYSCIAGVAVHRKCHKFTRFDSWRRTCLPIGVAICAKDNDENTPLPTVSSSPGVTSDKDNFVCPSFTGDFPHPNDCSKYYSCILYISTEKTCPKNQLFDAVKKKCQPEKKVQCGDRPRPGEDETRTTATASITSTSTGITEVKDNFACPSFRGDFPHPNDCSKYYSCILYISTEKTCPKNQLFDAVKKKCQPEKKVQCGDRPRPGEDETRTTATASITSTSTGITEVKDNFVCSSFTGTFPHPNDCSKYYKCVFYIATVKTCPEKELFDAVKKTCKPEKEVHCGDRPRPGYTTTSIPTETTTENIVTITAIETTTPSSTTESETITDTTPTATETVAETISTTTEMITDSTMQTDEEPFTNKDTTTDATSEDITTITTTTRQPTPPEHDCNEDDDDCIIKETGDPKNWFKCPRDVGSFPHPSSDKLFIFCMNWIPSAKKCGLGRIFSREMFTCVDV